MKAVRRHVPKIRLDIHDLVVAVQHVYRASGRLSLTPEPREELDDLRLIIAAVELIPSLHHDQTLANPLPGAINRAAQTQRGAQCAHVSVQIADGYDALDRGTLKARVERKGGLGFGCGDRGGETWSFAASLQNFAWLGLGAGSRHREREHQTDDPASHHLL